MSSLGGKSNREDDKAGVDRRLHVMETALLVFARYGYRRTSMEEVARSADISRQGLYFYFPTKQKLFQAAVTYALERDVTAAEHALEQTDRSLGDRLIEAFDLWTGRYVGPITQDISVLVDDNPNFLGPLVMGYPDRFATIIQAALVSEFGSGGESLAIDVAQTLLSTAYGVKHQVTSRTEFDKRMTIAVKLIMGGVDTALLA